MVKRFFFFTKSDNDFILFNKKMNLLIITLLYYYPCVDSNDSILHLDIDSISDFSCYELFKKVKISIDFFMDF